MAELLIAALLGLASGPAPTIKLPAGDTAAVALSNGAEKDQAAIEAFFSRPFTRPVAIRIVATRKDFDAALPALWGIAPSQCWMVGVGVYDQLVLLSPTAWKNEACDHRPGDQAEARQIFRHELVHALHGQYNPTKDFTGMDDSAWFVEGLATFVSGQLNPERIQSVATALAADKGPKALADAWSGKEKYGVAGSMVAYIDSRYGRRRLNALLPLTSNAAILRSLHISEQKFLRNWAAWLRSRARAQSQ